MAKYNGTSGPDTITGDQSGVQNDTINGGAGDDVLSGLGGTNSLNGGADNDTIYADGVDDSVNGGSGDDQVSFGLFPSGAATILGGAIQGGTGTDYLYIYGATFDSTSGAASFTGFEQVWGYAYGTAGNDVLDLSGLTGTGTITLYCLDGDDTVTGGAEIDNLYGQGGNDTLTGNDGHDWLAGGTGNDTLTGNDGDDGLDGGTGIDTLAGGAGNDTYYVDDAGDSVAEGVGGGTDTVYTNLASYTLGADLENLYSQSGTGGHTFTGNALGNIIQGGSGTNTLTGNDGNDSIFAYGVDDAVDAGGGDDYVNVQGTLGGAIQGGTGTDYLNFSSVTFDSTSSAASFIGFENVGGFAFGTAGNDVLDLSGLTGTGVFYLYGGDGDDTITGGAELDYIYGEGGNDTLTGNDGNDVLAGGTGNDTLTGNDGHDGLDGGTGADALAGGAGNDVYLLDDAGDSVTEGVGGGTDTIFTYLATYTLGADLENLASQFGTGDHTFTGNALDNIIQGGSGNDTLAGGAGNDALLGRGGSDTMDGGAGTDTLSYGNSAAGVTVSLATGTASGGDAGGDSFTGFEDLLGSGFADMLTGSVGANALTGLAGDDTLRGMGGTDVLDGGDGNDAVFGGDGIDTLGGGDGNDVLDGGADADTMAGGAGDDIYKIDNLGDTASENPGEGSDLVVARKNWTLGDNFENLTLSGSAIVGTGNALGNTIQGGLGGDTLSGLDGNDVLRGDANGDQLFGGSGEDRLFGGAGEDMLNGGTGEDLLTGGTERDVFRFFDGDTAATRGAADRIVDFDQALGEKIRLDGMDANTLVAGDQSFVWIGNGAFTGAARQLHFVQLNGNTFVEGDTNGDATADFVVRLDGLHSLVAGDFVL